MSKFSRLLVILLALVALMPVTRADNNQPITIKSAVVQTKDSRVTGEVKICNSEKERVKFLLDVKNLTINSIYKRSLSVDSGDCDTLKLRFTTDFAEMSNAGNQIRFVAKAVRGSGLKDTYDFSNTLMTKVVKGTEKKAGCANQFGDDGTFSACAGDFIYHEPSGLRIKVMANNSEYVDLKLIHIEWGGVKDLRVYKGRTKKIRSNFDELKRVEITNAYGENNSTLYLKIESVG